MAHKKNRRPLLPPPGTFSPRDWSLVDMVPSSRVAVIPAEPEWTRQMVCAEEPEPEENTHDPRTDTAGGIEW